MKGINCFYIFSILVLFCLVSNAQNPKDQEELKKCIDIGYIEDHDNLPGRIAINRITNNYHKSVIFIFINEYATPQPLRYKIKIDAKKKQEYTHTLVCNRVQAYVTAESEGNIIDIYYNPKPRETNIIPSEREEKVKTTDEQEENATVASEHNAPQPELKKESIVLEYSEDSMLPGRIVLKNIKNKHNKEVTVILTNQYSPNQLVPHPIKIAAMNQLDFPAGVVCNRVQAYVKSDSSITDIYYKPKTKEQN